MTISANLGFPRIGLDRELKKAVEDYWKGKVTEQVLLETARSIRKQNWQIQKDAGIDHIPSNDFSLYDHVLDTTVMLGVVPSRYKFGEGDIDLDTYFAMARGTDCIIPMEMTKWFDTNYHYIVPEFERDQVFSLNPVSIKIVEEFLEAKSLGIPTRPVLLGPVSYLKLGKLKNSTYNPIDLLERIIPVYHEILSRLHKEGAEWIQIDEPVLVMDLSEEIIAKFIATYELFCGQKERPKICLSTYFGSISDKTRWLCGLEFDALHLDLVKAPDQLDEVMKNISDNTILSLGVINGRNIWKTNLLSALNSVHKAVRQIGKERVMISPSCSFLHCPIDLEREEKLNIDVKARLAFAKQKLHEIKLIQTAVEQGGDAIDKDLEDNKMLFEQLKSSQLIRKPEVQKRLLQLDEKMFSRRSPYPERKIAQQKFLNLPILPTTTIGSFPQTPDIRKTRANYKKGTITNADYKTIMQKNIEKTIRFQEEIGLDVLVHGEPERNDMVEYFGHMLDGFAFTENGWIQSYGSRCVKPPIIYGDVSRPKSMTVEWAVYAQSLTSQYVKGMLTGPITILQWSFVREDQPRKNTAWQIALCIRDEVGDLEKAGLKIVQIDEPALREGAPLKKTDWPKYFDWATKAFRLATSSVQDETQVHTHMCYCDFNDIIEVIAALDADVISIEASRSNAELLDAFVNYNYPNQIGPGVYDIHSPRVPSIREIKHLLKKMLRLLDKKQLWVNPDCGLKTRDWPEVEKSLKNMVGAAIALREEK
jgi:5-methyltetrahydropteroyltriglutamate--homocysteine methyltransferase